MCLFKNAITQLSIAFSQFSTETAKIVFESIFSFQVEFFFWVVYVFLLFSRLRAHVATWEIKAFLKVS